MSATLSEKTADLHVEGGVTGQIAIGHHIVQVMADRGAIVNVTPPQEQIVPRRRAELAHRLPRPFSGLVGREAERVAAFAALAAGDPVEFHAEAGWGKSAVLRFLSHQQELAGPDGVFFDRVHDQPTDDILQSVFESLYETDGPFKPTPAQLREYLQDPEPLVVLDDVDAPRDDVQVLLDAAPRARFLLAAAERNLWGEGSALALGGLDDDAGLKLFERELGRALASGEVDDARAVCRILDGHPLSILQVAALVRSRRRSVADLLALLSSAPTAAAMAAAMTDELDAPQRAIAGLLAALDGVSLSVELVALISEISPVNPVIESLVRRGVAREDEDRIHSTDPLELAFDEEERAAWRRKVIAVLPAWVQDHRDHRDEVLGEIELIDAVIGWAFQDGNWQAVVELGRRVAPELLLGARWGSWARVVRRVLHASRIVEDLAAEAWSLNELALHIGLWEQDIGTSAAMLAKSAELWSSIGDEAGAGIARHNRAVLESPPSTVPPDESGPPRPPSLWRRAVIGFLMASAALIGGILVWRIISPNTLAVALQVGGSGAVTSVPSGIDCPGTCSNRFEDGSTVTITAVADDGWVLVRWAGACTGTPTTEPCHLKLAGDASVGATFAPVATSPTISVEVQGGGTVTSDPAGISCPSDCVGGFASGTTVSLSAHPDPGWKLARWGGACKGAPVGEACVLDRTDHGSAMAFFASVDPHAPAITVLVSGRGSVTTMPSGRDCRDRCVEGFRAGTDLILRADPDDGWTLSQWSEACAGTPINQPCLLHLSKDESAGATFVQTPIPGALSLAVQIRGSGALTSDPDAIDCPGACTAQFPNGTKVTLTADPEPGWEFSSWAGGCAGSDAARQCVLVVTKDVSVSATFSQVMWDISVGVAGQGTVRSDPRGIDCPGACSAQFADGTKVALAATPVTGWELSSWGGTCAGTAVTKNCVVVLTKAVSASMTFEQVMWNLSVTVNGQGIVTSDPGGIDCPDTCSARFEDGTRVTLTADPNNGWQLGAWRGSCSGTQAGESCVLVLGQDASAWMTFEQIVWPLRVTVDGLGTVASDPSGMSCRNDCTVSFPDGTRVTLTAVADPGWDFIGWGGTCEGTLPGQPCVLTMKGGLTATATFEAHVE